MKAAGSNRKRNQEKKCMCGICGVVNFSGNEPVDPGLLRRMTDTLAHRGPDDDGYFIDNNVGLGHRRLSIIDLSGGKQPIYNEDGSAVIVFNGEVYNYADLMSDLIGKGHTFRTRSDTEAILHAYEEYGDDCVHRLRGMFAFAIWDSRRKRLLLVRDRVGIKPVYVYQDGKVLAFASELKALLELPGIPRELDMGSLDLYLSLRYVPGPRTMFKNIFKLQPGHLLTVERGSVQTRQYWDLSFDSVRTRSSDDYVEEFNHLLEESVRLRMIAEVPLGVFLSGGLDSSSILGLMSKITGGERIKTFSVGYEGDGAEEKNEFYYARMAAKAFGAEHHEFRVKAPDFSDFIPDLVWHLDEPLADPSCIPLYFIAKLARQYITVVLSGEGADEVLAGYGIYQRMLALEGIYRSFGPLSHLLTPYLAPLIPGEARRNYLRMAGQPLEARYRGVSKGLRPELKNRLIPELKAQQSEQNILEVFRSAFRKVPKAAPLNQMLYVDTKIWLPEDILLKADKMTMANALELRVPFLDHKLIEFSARLPLHLKLKGSTGKFLLRQAMQGMVPDPIINRAKKGFPTPTAGWLRDPLKDFTRDALMSSDSACRQYMNSSVLDGILRDHETGAANRYQEIWTLLIFEFWHRLFLQGHSRGTMKTEQRVEVA
jgi:asparagine synthase (glutamine-hydrolysing)